MNRKRTVRVLYKSGNSIDIKCTEFSVKWDPSDSHVTEVSWVNASPRPLSVGLRNIEAIYEL